MRPTRKCEFCGKTFVPRSGMQKYCSEDCQAEAKRLRKKRQQDLINGIEPIMDLQSQEYLTFSKAAVLMGCTRQYVYKLVANGKLKASRLSNRMAFVRKSDIEKMFESNPYKRVIPKGKSWLSQKAKTEKPTQKQNQTKGKEENEVLDKFIHEGHEALSSFAKTDRVNFNEKESASIYYGIMASAVKHNIGLDSKASIDSAAKSFLSGMSWKGFTDFKQECVTSWTKLFATNEVQFTDNAIDTFLAFVDYMSCSADTYVSLGGSNGCADQLTNWDGTQKVGLGSIPQKKEKGLGR
uniref:helix-turn-helix domain-containing protein n=1 Tax=Prevotella sp. TaxID=59823 RepID=UPI003FEE1C75